MPTFPLLPGINTPNDRTEAKQLKLEAAAAAKKILLETKTGAGERQGMSDEAYALAAYEQAVGDDNAQEAKAVVSNDDAFTLLGSAIQKLTGASVGTARIAGDVASAPATTFADSQLSGVSDEHRALYQQEQDYNAQVKGLDEAEIALMADVTMGKVGPIEAATRRLELKNQRKGLVAPDTSALDQRPEGRTVVMNPTAVMAFAPSDYEDAGLIETPKTSRELIEGAKNALKFAGSVDKAIEGATEGLYNPIKRNSLDADMTASVKANKASFEAADAAWEKGDTSTALLEAGKGVAGLVKDFGADALNNPDAVLDYIAENTPQLAIGAISKSGQVLMAGTNLAYGMDIYRKGLEDYQAKNDGKLPTQDEATEMLGWSLSAAAAEEVGDVLTLSPLKGQLGKIMGGAVDKAKAGKLVGATAELARVPAAVAAGVVSEAPTEGYQTAVEENLSKLNSDFDFEQIAKAAGIGGMVGGGLKGGVETLSQTGDVAGSVKGNLSDIGKKAEESNPLQKAQEIKDAFEEAKTSGDVSTLFDETSPAYNPTAAISALHHYTQNTEDEIDPDEYLAYGESIIGASEKKVTELNKLVQQNSPEAREAAEIRIGEINTLISEATDPQAVEALEAEKEQIAARLLPEDQVEMYSTMAARETENLAGMKAAMKSWQDDVRGTDLSVEDVVAQADTDITEADDAVKASATQSVGKAMTLAMRRDSSITPDQMDALASNTKNALNDDQRSFLSRSAAARRAVAESKAMEDVNVEVFKGGEGFLGIEDYQSQFDKAQRAGDTNSATRALEGLANFARVHRAKLNVFTRAFDASEAAGGTKTYSFLPAGNGKWVAAPKDLTWKQVNAKGGVNISAQNSGSLLDAIASEVKALETSVVEMQAALKLPVEVQAPKKAASKRPGEVPVKAAKPLNTQQVRAANTPVTAEAASAPKSEPQAKTEVSTEPTTADNADTLALNDLRTRLTSNEAVPVSEVADWIRQHGRPSTVALMERLLEHPRVKAISDVQHFTPDAKSQRKEAGLYHPDTNMIQVNIDESAARHADSGRQLQASKVADTLVHEMVHAMSYDLIETNKELQQKVDELQAIVRDWLASEEGQKLPADVQERVNNSLANRQEFLTYALTDKRAQIVFSRIPASQDKSVFTEFVDTLLNLLKEMLGDKAVDDSVLKAAFAIGDDLLNGNAKAAKAEQERRSATWIAERTPPAAPNKSDYLGENAGVLSLFAQDVPEYVDASNHSTVNHVAAYFKQVGERMGSLTPRPLVAVKDFMARLKAGDVIVDSFLAEGLTESQAPLVNFFMEHHDELVAAFEQVAPAKANEGWGFREPVTFFRNEDGSFDQNFLTAVVAAAVAVLAEEVHSPQYRTKEQAALMLGQTSDTDIPNEVYHKIKTMNARRSVFENKLGEFVLDALGLKARDNNTPISEMPKLKAHLGGLVMNMLEDMDVVRTHRIHVGNLLEESADEQDSGELVSSENDQGTEEGEKFTLHTFVTLARDEGQLVDTLEELRTLSKGTGGVLSSLFGMEGGQQMPLLTPPKYTQKDTNKGLQKISKTIRKAIEKFAGRQMAFRPTMGMLVGASQGFLEDISGIENVDNLVMHAELRDSAKAANDNLRRELTQLQEMWMYFSELGNPFRNFYALPDQWKNSRIGYTGSWANMQTSKIARFLVAPVGWESEIMTTDTAPGKGQTSLKNFKLRIMEGLGAKTDSQADSETLKKWKSTIEAPHIVEAVEHLRAVVGMPMDQQKLSQEAETAIANAVKKIGSNLHGFEALVALAQWKNAQAAKQPSFKATVTVEVDGKTNGPMLSNWLLGVMDASFAAMGGFFTRTSNIQGFGQWKPGNNDLYEQTSTALLNDLRSLEFDEKSINSLFNLLGSPLNPDNSVSKAGRDLVKNPLTTLVYGSGLLNTVDKMTNVFVERVYETVAKIHEGKPYGSGQVTGVAAWKQFQEDLKEITDSDHYLFPATVQLGLEAPISKQDMRNLRESFKNSIGKAVTITIKEDFKGYMEARQQMTKQANATWNLYDLARRNLIESYTEHLMDFDVIKSVKRDGKRVPLRDLTPQEMEDALSIIKDMEPRMNTALSKRDGELDAGIYVAKTKRKLLETYAYTSDVKGIVNGKKTNHQSKPIVRVESDPGVSVMANGVQSLDGNTMVEVLSHLNSIGVHDAILVALHDSAEAGKALNQQVMDMLLIHSLPRESYEALSRTLMGYVAFAKQNPESLDKKFLAELLMAQKKDKKDFVNFTTMVERAAKFAYESDYSRLTMLSEIGIVDQYTIESGVFEVPESFSRQALKMRDQLNPVVDQALLEAARELDKLVFDKPKEAPKAAKSKASPRQTQMSEEALDELLQEPGLTGNVLATKLFNSLGTPVEGDTMGRLYREILKRGIKNLQGVPVRYVTDESQIPEDAKDAFGWYHVDENGEAHIGIRGSNLSGSGITTELVVHELLHALVAATIEQAEKGQGDPAVLKAVAELDSLRKDLQSTLSTEFKEALSNVQEFVAWGMTNPAFQKAMAGVPVQETVLGQLKNKAQEFFRAISKIIFGTRGPEMETALSMFIARVSVIVGDAETNKVQAVPGTHRMAAQFNPLALFESLSANGNGYSDPAMQERVAGLMSSVVDAVGGPFQKFYQAAAQGATSPAAVVNNALANGLMPVSAGLRTSGFALGDQQAYAIEMLTEAFQEAQRDTTHEAEKQLLKLFKETAGVVTPADLGGQSQWDAIFGAKAVDNSGEYLARFAAMALAYPPLANKMGFTTKGVEKDASTMYGRVLAFFETILNLLAQKTHKAYAGQRADAKLNTITQRLVALEAKYQLRQQPTYFGELMNGIEDKVDAGSEAIRKKVISVAKNLSTSNNKVIRSLGNVSTMVAEHRVGEILDHYETIYHRMTTGQMGTVASLFNELRGTRAANLMGRMLLVKAKTHEKERQEINRVTAGLLADSFETITKEESDAITQVMLRGDVQALLDDFTLAQINDLLADDRKLNKAISQWVAKFPANLKTYYDNQSDYTAYVMAMGEDKGFNTQLNIENLADLSGTKQAGTLSRQDVMDAADVLDVLVTLKAIRYMPAGPRLSAAQVMSRELRRGKDNGVNVVLQMHRSLMDKSREAVFKGEERLMRKGYVPEIHNPHIELVAVEASRRAELEPQGYNYEGFLPADPTDVTYAPRVLMSVEKMSPRIVSGTLSSTSMKAAGSSVHTGLEMFDFSGVNQYSLHTNRRIAKRREQSIAALFNAPHGKDLTQEEAVRMTPTMNADGNIANYRYMMSHARRDSLLERNNAFDQVLAEMASNTYDKQITPQQNAEVVQAIKDQWDIEQATTPEAYIVVGPASSDKVLRERYLQIPYATRKEIERVWGGPNMMIRRDLVDLHLGYRKASLTDLLTDDGKHEGIVKDFFLWLAKNVFNIGPKGLRRILKAENIIAAVNQEIKDFFVVKSGVTTFWNIVSNMTLLKLYGVSIQEIVRSHRVALKGARDWHEDSSELRKLKAMKDANLVVGGVTDLDQQIAILEDQLARNPVREVMELGMMPTIVEDMDAADDPYSYKNYTAKKVEKYTQYVPKFVKQGAKFVYMTHDTPLYQVMSQGAQMSDFVARYTLFEHLKTRRKNPLSMGEAAAEAIDAFINYDLPSGRWVQYANDMGIVRFTKYYLRIQAVLAHLYQNNPARVLFLATLENFFDGMQTVMDSGWWTRIGNSPLESGPLDAMEALESGLISRMLGKLF